jgi:hypothetical protein
MGNTILPGKLPLDIKKGVDYTLVFEVEIDGVILNLTGATVEATIREGKKEGSTELIKFTPVISEGVDTGYDSDISLSLTDTQTASINVTTAFYDVLVIDSQGTDTYYLEGQVNFLPRRTVKT